MSDGFTGKVEHGVKMLIMVLWSVIMLGLFFVCIIETVDLVGDMDVAFNSDSPVINILCILVFMLIAAAITSVVRRFIPDRVISSIRKNMNIIGIIITGAVGIFLVWWISITHYEPVSDQMLCFDMARQFIDGNYSNWSTGYMSVYPFQNGIALYLLFDSVMTKKLKSTIGLVIVLAIYMAGSRSFNIAVEKLTDTPLAQGIPKIAWVAMGMNESVNTPGWFDNYNGYVYEKNNRDQDATVAEAISHIKQRGKAILTTNPLRFYNKKITSQWNNPTWDCFDMQGRESHTPDYAIKAAVRDGNNTVWKELMNMVQTLINFGVLIYIAGCWKRFDSLTVYELFNAVLMIGAFVFFTFWEAKSQYVAPYYFVIIPYAVIGWKRLISVICQEINNGKTS